MKKSRRHLSSPDFSEEDRHAHKYSKHVGLSHDKHQLTEDLTLNVHGNPSEAHSRMSHRQADDVDSELDEVLTKHRLSRRLPRRDKEDIVSRHIRDIENAQREVSRPGSSSSQEIHIHYHSSPFGSHHDSRSLLSAASTSGGHATRRSKGQGITASDLTQELRGMTMSWISKREESLSHKRSKHGHEKRGKHGKKKDTFLAPLEQRWVCYECGKVRSDKIQERHPLTGGQKMQPNWCGQCRITHELKGSPLDWHGQRHYCWGCGIVRSEKYHRENPISEGELSEPNYCKPCRESSPNFERNLREASDIGSEISVRDKAFQRQMRDAELSDIHEDEDEDDDSTMSNSAPGKENENPEKARKVTKATSFLLKNRAFKTKTCSDTSSEGSIPIKMLKAIHLEAEKTFSFGGQAGVGGARLSSGSYKPPSVESTLSGSSLSHADTQHTSGEDKENVALTREVDCEMRDADTGKSYDNSDKQDDASPTILAFPHRRTISSSPKKVHWSDNGSRPTTADSKNSDFSNSFRSETSVTSAGSLRRPRRNPAETSTGSPPEKDGVHNEENIGDSLRRHSVCPEKLQSSSGGSSGHGLPPSQGTFGEKPEFGHDTTHSYTRGQTLSAYGMPPTPPQERYGPYFDGDHTYKPTPDYWDSLHARSPTQGVPNFSRPYQSPQQTRPVAPHYAYDGPSYGTRPEHFSYAPHDGFDSAAHFSDKDSRRDFSGNSYYDATTGGACEYTSYQNDYNFEGPFGHMYSHHDGTSHRAGGETYMYTSHYDSHGDYPEQPSFGHDSFSDPVPPPSSARPFDFSSFGNGQDHNKVDDDFYSHVPDEEDVRRLTRNFMSPTPPPQPQPQWHLYDDGDDEENHGERGCEWQGNGQTTIHRPSSDNSASSGKMMTILSIREIEDDEGLSTPVDVAADYDAAMRSICEA